MLNNMGDWRWYYWKYVYDIVGHITVSIDTKSISEGKFGRHISS